MIYTAYGNRINKNDRAQEWQINGQSRAFKPRTLYLTLPETHYINESTTPQDDGILQGLPSPSVLTNRKNYVLGGGNSDDKMVEFSGNTFGATDERIDNFALPRIFSKNTNLFSGSRLAGYYDLDENNRNNRQQTFYIDQG